MLKITYGINDNDNDNDNDNNITVTTPFLEKFYQNKVIVIPKATNFNDLYGDPCPNILKRIFIYKLGILINTIGENDVDKNNKIINLDIDSDFKTIDFISEDKLANWILDIGGILHTRKISNIDNDLLFINNKNNTIIVCLTGYDVWIDWFFKEKVQKIKNKFILITIETDFFTLKDIYLNDPKLLHWYCWNKPAIHPKLTAIPIGLNHDRMLYSLNNYLLEADIPQVKTKLVACTYLSNTNVIRNEINKAVTTGKWNDFITFIPNIPYIRNYQIPSHTDGSITINITSNEFYRELSKYKFVISPPGAGHDCHRTWEALYLDTIPIVINSSISEIYKDLPILVVNNFNEINKEFLEQTYLEISKKREKGLYNLDKIKLLYWKNYIYPLTVPNF